MTIQSLQQWVRKDWIERSSALPSKELQLLYLLEEIGEIAEAIRKVNGHKNRTEESPDIGSEIADAIIALITIANEYNVDLELEMHNFQERLQKRHNQGF